MRACVLWAALAGVAAAAPAEGPTANARRHFLAGRALYLQGRHREAIAELEAGYQMDPRPEYLADLGQAHRALGELDVARDYYRRFLLATPPDTEAHRAARVEVEALLAAIDRPSERRDLAPARPPPRPRWYRSEAGWVLAGAGSLLISIGAAVLGATSGLNQWEVGGGTTLLVLGAGLGGVGTAWFVREHRRCDGDESSDEACGNHLDDNCDGAADCADRSCDGRRCAPGRFCRAGRCEPGCRIDGLVRSPQEPLLGNACLACDPARLDSGWSPASDGASCTVLESPGICHAGACCCGCWDGVACRGPAGPCGGAGCAACRN
jgi:Tetratricopeptide repeat